jgi:uncharacterized protein YmfQ (DUF2313 family)
MPEITLTEEQAKQLAGGFVPVVVKDPSGRVVGRLEPTLSPEMIAELKRRASGPGPFYTGDQMRARLHALEAEWQRVGGFDIGYALELLDRLNQKDPGRTRDRGAAG